MITRRQVLVMVGAGALAVPLVSFGQQQVTRIYRVGFLANGAAATSPTVDAFRQGLRDHGYVEGRNLALEIRWAEGRFERMPEFAADLVRRKPDVLVAAGPYGIFAVRQATSTIPVVMIACEHAEAIVEHIARPSGHITGVTCMSADITPKRLQLLKEAVPRIARVAVLYSNFDANKVEEVRQMQDPARTLGITLLPVAVQDAALFEQAVADAARERVHALFVLPDPLTLLHRQRIADLAAKHRLPSMYGFKEFVLVGGLMSYGTMQDDLFRRAAAHLDKVLKGAKPADLPVEQPTKFELVINMKTAKALGITIPQSILIRADRVIE